MSFLQRVAAAVGSVSGAASGAPSGSALRAAGPVALGRFLRRRWLPLMRPAMTLAREADDEDLEERSSEEPTPSASPSVQTVRRTPVLRRSESPSATAVAPQVASELDSASTAPVAQLARVDGAAAPSAAANRVLELPASRAAAAAAPRAAADAPMSAAASVHQRPPDGVLSAPAEPAFDEPSSPGLERIEARPDAAPRRAIAPLSGAALATVAQRAAEIVSAASSPAAAPPARGEAAAFFAPPARPARAGEPAPIVAAPGESAESESALPARHAGGEPAYAMAPTRNPGQLSVDAGPGRARIEPRDELRAVEPLVQIGSIEIIIEAAPEPKAPATLANAAPDLSSRFYLRGL
jgi:hypothetical protein